MKRKEAKASGLKTYNTGKPCKRGHFSDRYVSGQCIECVQLQAQNWRANNPEKHKQAMQKWWENNKETHNTRVKRWQATNKEKTRLDAKTWSAANPDKVAAKAKRYRNLHPGKINAWSAASAAKRAKRLPKWLTDDDKWMLAEAYALAKLRTKMFGFEWEVDHIIPLQGKRVSGLHVPTNVQVVPKVVNRAKQNTYDLT
jgi:hypothetical protein